MTALKDKRRANNTTPRSSIVAALNMIGDGWTFLILREAFFQVRRFEEIRNGLAIPRARLTERLSSLVAGGVLTRLRYQNNPPRYEYKLTAMGRDVYDMTLAMKEWADKWRKDQFPFLAIRHSLCGSVIRPIVICRSCQTAVTPHNVAKAHDRPIAQEGTVINKRRALPNDIYDRGKRREAVAETLKVMGDQRSVAILHEAFQGSTKFVDFHARTGVARNTLTVRLNHLVQEGVLQKKCYQKSPARHEYRLTHAGWDLLLVDLTIEQWGRRWLFGKRAPAPSYLHLNCDAPLEAMVVCKACKQAIDPKDTHFA